MFLENMGGIKPEFNEAIVDALAAFLSNNHQKIRTFIQNCHQETHILNLERINGRDSEEKAKVSQKKKSKLEIEIEEKKRIEKEKLKQAFVENIPNIAANYLAAISKVLSEQLHILLSNNTINLGSM